MGGGYILFAEIERLLRNPHADLFVQRIWICPWVPVNVARSCRQRLNVKPRWLNGNIDTLVHSYINTIICNWCNLMDCVSVRGFGGAILFMSKALIMMCDRYCVNRQRGEDIQKYIMALLLQGFKQANYNFMFIVLFNGLFHCKIK